MPNITIVALDLRTWKIKLTMVSYIERVTIFIVFAGTLSFYACAMIIAVCLRTTTVTRCMKGGCTDHTGPDAPGARYF